MCNISTSKLQYGDILNICTRKSRKVLLGFDELRVVSDFVVFQGYICVPAITHWYNLLPFYSFHNILLLLQFKEMCCI